MNVILSSTSSDQKRASDQNLINKNIEKNNNRAQSILFSAKRDNALKRQEEYTIKQ